MKKVYYIVWNIKNGEEEINLRSKCDTPEAAKEKLEEFCSRLSDMGLVSEQFVNDLNTDPLNLINASEGEVSHELTIGVEYEDE